MSTFEERFATYQDSRGVDKTDIRTKKSKIGRAHV